MKSESSPSWPSSTTRNDSRTRTGTYNTGCKMKKVTDDEEEQGWRRPRKADDDEDPRWWRMTRPPRPPSFPPPSLSLHLSFLFFSFHFFLSFVSPLLVFSPLLSLLSFLFFPLLQYHFTYSTLPYLVTYLTSLHIRAHVALEPPQEATTVGASLTYIS